MTQTIQSPPTGGSFFRDESGVLYHRCPVSGKTLNKFDPASPLPVYAKRSDIPGEFKAVPVEQRPFKCAEDDAPPVEAAAEVVAETKPPKK